MFQGGNSIVTHHNYIIKELTKDQDYDEPLNVAALREAYLQELARSYYRYIPKVAVHYVPRDYYVILKIIKYTWIMFRSLPC